LSKTSALNSNWMQTFALALQLLLRPASGYCKMLLLAQDMVPAPRVRMHSSQPGNASAMKETL
jgi:hypothetical protein